MTSSTKLRAGLVGFGTAAQFFHMPLLLSSGRFEITHVMERSKSLSRDALPSATIVRSMADLVAAPIDVVVIATPTNLHFEQAKIALEAKKHVVVDKPMCVTSAEASVLIETARANSVVLTVFQNRRWDSDFLTVRKLLESKTLGDLSHFEAHFDRFRPSLKGNWKESADVGGGGLLYDLGAHLVDQMLTLFGPPTSISSDVQSQREGCSNDDYFRLECQYPGLLVVLTAGMLVENPTPKYTIRGANGSFIKYGEDGQETALRAGRTPLTDGDSWGHEPEAHYGVLKRPGQPDERVVSEPGNYSAYYIGLADTIQHGAARLVHPEESAAGIAILEKAKAAFLVAQA
ncbi:hypothetical protein SDRG_06265 [Saprolegnia diclina VS20]|uniref:Oxidoreductase n=1 Tax=Saprolegnia diclina (strain VS20) TaxID=1156394 RepID=T0QE24_SAPDV|nr:hypothetical protein SDRG_06265 [Saprolegnia diclina VS20]EQC36149.1 hypothetical protein SDRG_06265 [Saprolegnia diclina VS20]|eukprot:XP_008610255.1 hypothetical protein SDRG_06265 [Saprolegnia diclina VS20]